MDPMVSVIIPVYNARDYLRQCLDSVVNQTWNNLQIVCVDDSSTDDSLEILREYARKDDRIQVFTKENEHVSMARNFALERARGTYLLFLDSDDWLDPDTVEVAVQTAQTHAADVVLWSYVREMGTETRKKHIFDGDIVFDREAVRTCLYRRLIGPVGEETAHPENIDALCPACVKLYRADLIREHQITFYDIRKTGTFEDGLFNIEVFSHARKAVFLDRYFYHYRRNREDSLTRVYKPLLPDQWDKLYGLMGSHIEERDLDDSFRAALSNRIALSLVGLGTNEMESSGSPVSKLRRIRMLIRKPHCRKALKSLDLRYLPIHWKLFFLGAKMGCAWGVYLLLLVIQKIRGR